MKLINENLARFKLIVFIILVIIESIALFLVLHLYKPIYLNTFELTKNFTINKTITATRTLKDLSIINYNRHLCDLKLIGKHMSFLGNEANDTRYIKRSSELYKNILLNTDRKIVYGTMEELKKIGHLYEKYYDAEQERFDYFSKYYKYYYETGKQANIIQYLKNNSLHPELNMIAYYKLNGNANTDINLLSENKKRAAIYLISILKTNIIRRFISKGKDYEFMNYILFVEDEMFIYPPEAFNNTHIFYKANLNQFDCGRRFAYQNFPKCIYRYVNNRSNNYISKIPGYISPIVIGSKIYYDQLSTNFCINIPFEKYFDLYNLTYNPFFCQEYNMTKNFFENNFEQKEGFEFIIFYIYESRSNKEIIPIYNGKNEKYDQIKIVFDDEKFKNFSINATKKPFNHYSLFHFLYLDIFKDKNIFNKLNKTIDEIIDEYLDIVKKIFEQLTILSMLKKNDSIRGEIFSEDNQGNNNEKKVIDIEKTSCQKNIYKNNITCSKETFIFIIHPMYNTLYLMNENFLEDKNHPIELPFLYCLSIINNNNNYMQKKFKNIMLIKIIKLFLFFIVASVSIILFYFFLVHFFFVTRYNTINQILDTMNNGSFFEMKDSNEIIFKKDSLVIQPNNKDMAELKNIFDNLTKTMLLKFNFEEKSIYFNINNKNQNNLDSINEYMDLIKSIANPETKIMCIYIISYNHFKKRMYKLAENEFKNLIIDINIYEDKISNKNEDSDSKLKDSLSRCSKISYLNEYSLTSGMNETTLPIIKAKLLKQKIFYLYALCIYNQEKSKKNINNNKDNKKSVIEINKQKYEEAIKYFMECKNISSLLGTDTIREIFSLIMISKCYIELRNYKESMININEALLLYNDLQKSFKDKSYFNPKVILFVANFVFQSVMLTMAQTTYSFNKLHQSCWILMKIIDTSPFLLNNIHYNTCYMLNNCLKQIEANNSIPLRQLDKYRKNINKMFSRINIRLTNEETIKMDDMVCTTNNNTSNNNVISNQSVTNTQISSINFNYIQNNLRKINKKDFLTSKLNSASMSSTNPLNKNKYKNITLCISEKIIMNINGEELKDVLLKFFQKCFSNSTEEDKFSFIQFSYNGKKTISIKSETLDLFLQKLESNKGAFQLNENYNKTSNEFQFMEFSNLFISIIKSQKQRNFEDRIDNIIILFINTEDIRFNGKKECVDTINELNSNNYTLIIFTYDTLISNEKIMSIYSFLYGLNDAHFFQIKNYQQIKQVLMNFSLKESQEKFVNYDYEIADYML